MLGQSQTKIALESDKLAKSMKCTYSFLLSDQITCLKCQNLSGLQVSGKGAVSLTVKALIHVTIFPATFWPQQPSITITKTSRVTVFAKISRVGKI